MSRWAWWGIGTASGRLVHAELPHFAIQIRAVQAQQVGRLTHMARRAA